jgi:hypothetical protein
MKTLMFMVVFMIMTASLAVAESTPVTVDVSKLPPEIAAQVINAQQLAEGKSNPVSTTKKVEEWAEFGERFGKVIATVAKELGIAANDFVKTPVGKLTAIAIIWKTFGKDWWSIVGGTFGWMFTMAILMWSYVHFHMNIKIKNKETGEVSFVRRYEFKSRDYEYTSHFVHCILFVIFTAISAIIVF